MNPESYRPIIFAGHEDRNREYKGSFPWDRKNHGSTIANVTKTILAMSNLRDGGHIVIGVNRVSEGSKEFKPVGVQNDHVQTFSYDDIATFVGTRASPYVSFTLNFVRLDEMTFVVITVAGFDEFPVICKKGYGNVLSAPVVYVRPRGGIPRSEPISDYVDLRELWDLSIERGVRRFIEMQAKVSVPSLSDEMQFEQQVGDFS